MTVLRLLNLAKTASVLSVRCAAELHDSGILALLLVPLQARLPLPTNVKPSTRIDLVAFDKAVVGLMCNPLALIESGVAEDSEIQSCGVVGPVPEAKDRRIGSAWPYRELWGYIMSDFHSCVVDLVMKTREKLT